MRGPLSKAQAAELQQVSPESLGPRREGQGASPDMGAVYSGRRTAIGHHCPVLLSVEGGKCDRGGR